MKKMRAVVRGFSRRAFGLPQDAKHEMVERAVSAVNSWQVPGDYLEFGLYEGRSFTYAYKALQRSPGPTRRLIGFDSFKGLPEPLKEEGTTKFQRGQYACSRKDVEENLLRSGVDLDATQLVEGFFDETLTNGVSQELGLVSAAVVWIDCDLYSSTVSVLDFISPLISTGSILCFDDWFSYGTDPTKGELRAVREWLDRDDAGIELSHYRNFGISGRSFVVSRR